MKLFLLLALFSSAVVAQSLSGQAPPRTSAGPGGTPRGSDSSIQPPGSTTGLELEGALGFSSLYYLLNAEAWPTLPASGRELKRGVSVVDLDDPLRAVVLFNAWHLPSAHGADDIRLADLRENVLRRALTFTPEWPPHSVPGYVVAVQKRNLEWALIANLGRHYLVEDRSGIGVFASPSR
jgi:hypothetical protein